MELLHDIIAVVGWCIGLGLGAWLISILHSQKSGGHSEGERPEDAGSR